MNCLLTTAAINGDETPPVLATLWVVYFCHTQSSTLHIALMVV